MGCLCIYINRYRNLTIVITLNKNKINDKMNNNKINDNKMNDDDKMNDTVVFKCNICDRIFKSDKNLKQHFWCFTEIQKKRLSGFTLNYENRKSDDI